MSQTHDDPIMNDLRVSVADRLSISRFRLWFGTLGGALMWLLHLVAAYLISEFGCVSWWGERIWLGLTLVAWAGLASSFLMVVGTILSHHVALNNQKQLMWAKGALATEMEDGREILSYSGVLANRIFIFIILVQSIPFLFYLQGC